MLAPNVTPDSPNDGTVTCSRSTRRKRPAWVTGTGRFWLVLWSAVVVLSGEDRGDRQRCVRERDLDVAVAVSAPLDERQRGQDPFGVGEVLSRGAGWLWCAVHGPGSVRSRAPVWCQIPTG